ncbi:ATP-dependent helicase [Nonomuraea sp. PA05]|uniref:UvrD-helicase domain-containing protein n=1 Tax=Nonomuraea sp. PA05 TaxID=2604466 RepID=UPI0011D8A715|nr:UvrD-helicase domain-containing protein [Nonomuraea sp. PA05]TYB50257.1 ATP-dependent helicase [Nonomuraea sp. PA05]
MFTQPTPYTEAAAPLFTVPQPPVHAPAAPAPVAFEHPPTIEQQAILDAAAGGDPLVIEAGAGTGKTSTLKMLAAAQPRRRALYLAYNKAIAEDARATFPANTQCSTAHSLAFRQVGHQFKDRLNGPRLPAREVARFLQIPAVLDLGKHALTSVKVARIVMDAIKRFCYSDRDEPSAWHIPDVPGLEGDGMTLLREQAYPFILWAWGDLQRQDGRLKFEHDHYLKMWALTNPTLPADVVFLDEAQDANPVISRIVEAQTAQRILVGDQSQAIYGWRGAVDAMQEFEGEHLSLSQSFRFGQQIADTANEWLQLLDAPLRLTGNPARDSKVGVVDQPGAVLCRTNAGAIGQAMSALTQGLRPALVGGGADIRNLARACQDLQNGRPTEHPELMAFTSWDEVREYAEHDAGGADLRTLVKLVDGHGPAAILRVVDQLVDESNADIVVSTAHRAKGREWATVRLAADWQDPYDKDGRLNRSEAMLSYVAVTRAKDVLDCRNLNAAKAGGTGFQVLVDDEETLHRLEGPDPVIPRTALGPTAGAADPAGSPAMNITVAPIPSHDVLTPDPPRADTDLPAELVGWLQYAKQAADNEKQWREAKDASLQKIKDWMGERGLDEATVNGRPAATWRESKTSTYLDAKSLEKDHPDIHAAYQREKKASRPFNFAGDWK